MKRAKVFSTQKSLSCMFTAKFSFLLKKRKKKKVIFKLPVGTTAGQKEWHLAYKSHHVNLLLATLMSYYCVFI